MARFDPTRWSAVIFDVDGTLYDQRPLRRAMARELLAYCASRPWRVGLLKRLQSFRHERERLGELEAQDPIREQYARPAAKLGIPPETLAAEVEEWFERRPLRHLPACRVPGVRRFFGRLRSADVAIGVLSDYPASAKLEALGLGADLIVSGVDPEVNRLKPHPAGLERVLARLGLPADRCLMIGDRDDRDGEIARRVGMEYRLRDRDFRDFVELIEPD